MSVFGESPYTMGTGDQSAAATQTLNSTAHVANNTATPHPPDDQCLAQKQPQQQHRDSTSTLNSDSTDSSPTTTISTMDSASVTEPSPSSLPESPVSFSSNHGSNQTSEDLIMDPASCSSFDQNRPISPAKKARNMKGLSLNMGASKKHSNTLPPLKTASLAEEPHTLSAPASPSFILPPKPPKRRPSNLGLITQTPGIGSLPEKGGLKVVPPTPSTSMPNTLRHFQSSPALSLFSPSIQPEGGMQLPAFNSRQLTGRFARAWQRPTFSQASPFEAQEISPVVTQRLDELEEEDQDKAPLSQEAKSPAYPAGPVCIYEPYVYLYLEPNDEEASDFDVVLNVAREVKNPFKAVPEIAGEESTSRVTYEVRDLQIEDRDSGLLDTAATPTGPSNAQSGLQSAPGVISPTTPKATKVEPEYIHIPWDHNTNIVDDMLRLVELIDDRVSEGKRVLVHCQCGVSRSASLIVAYGLYKNPNLSVQEAYDAVKDRSRWIGPNMNLIYQLSEFKSKLPRTPVPPTKRRAGRSTGNGRSNTIPSGSPTSRSLLAPFIFEKLNSEPHTAPLPAAREESPDYTSNRLNPVSPLTMTRAGLLGDITPGPSSAPSSFSWIPRGGSVENHGGSWGLGNENMGYVPPPLPPDAAFIDNEGTAITLTDVHHFRNESEEDDKSIAPQTFSATDQTMSGFSTEPPLLSPRVAEFTASPFHRPDPLETSPSLFEVTVLVPKPSAADPRSPAQRGEAPIIRNIEDVL
ncbi:MAG: hypothetical protein M1827_006819 [Pycnora praestabilis]|nr:MAG: hypothetical protein M1827_006819 [Pycnora praestabilis]